MLNDDSMVYISSFLSEKDKWTLIRKTDNHILINLTKRAKVKFHLTQRSSRRYHEDTLFRQDVQSITGQDNDGQYLISLELSNYRDITDVSALGGVQTLDLHKCSGITDVSALGGVQTLDLHKCYGITDVSALGGVLELFAI